MDVFSVRVVVADYYMRKPIPGLDPTSCEFRGREIKRVPVIRIFGANSDGVKTCMHVHGVFPYFYIPYDSSDLENIEAVQYQVAGSIDRAINVSMGQGSSTNSHVFKVQLVKGIPFYGFHRKEHQFLKIFMFNPRHIRKAASMVQNGIILNRVFHPHESHVPYVQQFMIDYNLYGMSFVHVPIEVLKFRKSSEDEVINFPTNSSQILDFNKVQKVSLSSLELDIAATFILNRFQIGSKSADNNSNPGIEAIWQDERNRRNKLSEENVNVPPLEPPPFEIRNDAKITDSHIFYKTALERKIFDNPSSDQTLNETTNLTILGSQSQASNVSKKSAFNLKKFMENSVYPEECTPESNLTNASFIHDHLSSTSTFHTSGFVKSEELAESQLSDSVFFDDTIVDEEMILALSQSQSQKLNLSLNKQDHDFLNILEDLEDNAGPDLDSTLSQLTQNGKKESQNNEGKNDGSDSDSDSDNNSLNNYTMAMEDIDDILLKLTQTSDFSQENNGNIPQLDGSNSSPSTPNKQPRTPNKNSPRTPRTQRTPRTPRTTPKRRLSGRYVPLEMVKTTKLKPTLEEKKEELLSVKSEDHVSNSSRESFLQEVRRSKRRSMSLRRKLVLNEINKNCEVLEDENEFIQNPKTPIRDETRLTCKHRTRSSTKKNTLKTYNIDSSKVMKKFKSFDYGSSRNLSDSSKPLSPTAKVKHFLEQLSTACTFIEDTVNLDETEKDTSESTLKNLVAEDEKQDVIESSPPNDSPFRKRRRKSFKHRKKYLSSEEYDKKNNFYPEPGSSKSIPEQLPQSPKSNSSIESFYEKSFVVNSPQLFSQTPSSTVKSLFKTPLSSDDVIITPLELPPSSYEVDIGCLQFNIEEYSYQKPYFSESEDLIQKRQVGHNLLYIPGNSLNDLQDFGSVFSKGIASIRKEIVTNLEGPLVANQLKTVQALKEYVSSRKTVVIRPLEEAPTFKDCTKWLKARNTVKDREKKAIDEDSPITVKRQKVIMIVNENGNESVCDMTMTPLTCDSKDILEKTPTPQNISKRKSRKSLFKAETPKINVKSQEKLLEPIKASQSQDKDTTTSQSSSQISNANSFKHDFDASFGISAPSLNNTYGFKVNLENLNHAKSDIEYTQLTTMNMELFAESRGELLPNPEFDPISCIFYSIELSYSEEQLRNFPKKEFGIFIVGKGDSFISGLRKETSLKRVNSELELFEKFIDFIKIWDPDILAGYEIEMGSWGYLMDRAKYLNLNIAPMLSRVPSQKIYETDEEREQFTMMDIDTETKLCGRILLDVWRLMRSEIALTSYTFENMIFHVLHRRVPFHTHVDLTSWYRDLSSRWIVLEYYLERVNGTMELLDQLDLIGRTSEMAKLIGIQFYEVLSRGSQFRVESMMLRMAKPKNLVPLSPSVEQRAHSRAPEYLPLILEPQSRMYTDPLIVLDFQSLYPSVMMAYNYCYSTCLGRVEHLGSNTPFEFGAAQLRVNPKTVKQLLELNEINISPCGVVFVNPRIREGILPKMVKEILDTRQMVKQSMKIHKNSSALQRILHSRQLGLKLMANVTYGYTAANWSGRMPCVEVADSILSKGRECLERAIKFVEAHDEWRAKVVYGDTDSLFVLLPGRSKDEAFTIGEEIAEAVTKENPFPVKLKMEKVYLPCILQTKKRYVGFMYETQDQEDPVYEAKGIETVRRDGCPAVAKMLEKVLRILFETKDVSLVKSYVCRQFTKLLSGKANLQDLIFAKEFRGMNGYKPTACVPALEMTRNWIQQDPRRVPRRGERVPFIVTNGPPGLPLIKLVRHPSEVLANDSLIINAMYYITKAIIPPLNRCLLLIGADVNEWFAVLPRKLFATHINPVASEKVATVNPFNKKSTISQYFSSTNCVVDCGNQTKHGICSDCLKNSQKVVTSIQEKIYNIEKSYESVREICQSCCQRSRNIKCESLVCPVLYVLRIKERETNEILLLRKLLCEHF